MTEQILVWIAAAVKVFVIRRYQYTAIDDVTWVPTLKIYYKHNQKNSIDLID